MTDTTYTITETTDAAATRKGFLHPGPLKAAKAAATRSQVFRGTVLKITDEHGQTIATRHPGGRWIDAGPDAQQRALMSRAADASAVTR
jgi:hypothetical protein